MRPIQGTHIAQRLIALNVNLICWSRGHLEQAFSVNGKGEEEKLTLQQFHLMIHIEEVKLNTVSELATALNLSKSSASLTIGKLVTKGYVRREQPTTGDDGRKVYFYLTEKGRKALEKTENTFVDIIGTYFDYLEDDAKQAVCTHLDGINQLLVAGGSKG